MKLTSLAAFFIVFVGSLLSSSTLLQAADAKVLRSQRTEALGYTIYFHIGFVWAKAGYGDLEYYKETLSNNTVQQHGRLAARSLSVVEHIMKVRDTLDCYMNAEGVPTSYRKGTHEGSYNAIAHNTYRHFWKASAAHDATHTDSAQVTIERWRKKNKEKGHTDTYTFSNKGVAYDMLSVFYTIRHLNYASMTKGKKMQYVCYDGVKQQTIHVEYQGQERCELRSGKHYNAYLVYLTFATKGQDATPLKVWLSQTSDQRPVKAVIALKRIGSVQCEIDEE